MRREFLNTRRELRVCGDIGFARDRLWLFINKAKLLRQTVYSVFAVRDAELKRDDSDDKGAVHVKIVGDMLSEQPFLVVIEF